MNYHELASRLLHQGVVVTESGDHIGKVGQVFTDNRTGQPTWVTVRTGLFGTRESFVPLDSADIDGELIRVPFDKEMIRGAPHLEVGDDLTEQQEMDLHNYYAIAGAENPDAAGAAPSTAVGGGQAAGVTQSEEHLQVGTRRVEARRARLHKFVVTEPQTVTVPVTHDEVRVIREPITEANREQVLGESDFATTEYEVVLTEDLVLVEKDAVPVERVSVGRKEVTEQHRIVAPVRAEQVELDTRGSAAAESSMTQRKES